VLNQFTKFVLCICGIPVSVDTTKHAGRINVRAGTDSTLNWRCFSGSAVTHGVPTGGLYSKISTIVGFRG
jgi:hypothetical protein